LPGVTSIRLWTTNDKSPGTTFAGSTNILNVPPSSWSSDGTFRYRDFWIEGVGASVATADELINLRYQETSNTVDTISMTVLGVERVEWLGINNSFNNDPYLDDADTNWRTAFTTFGGNVRVFPDARWDGTQVGDLRDEVFLQVTLSTLPPVPLRVYLREFDVDDPSADSDAVDNESWDFDNRYLHAGLTAGSFWLDFTTAEFQRSTHFGVGLIPGDNYRIVAHADLDFLDQLENDDRDFTANFDKQRIVDPNITQPTATAADMEIRAAGDYVSPTLTVWRLMNTELDTMPSLGDGNTVFGNIVGVVGIGTAVTRVSVDKLLGDDGQDLNDAPTEFGRFEAGTITVGQATPGGTAVTINNIIGNGNYFVELRPTGTPASIAGLGFTAEDHDYYTTPETMLGTVTEITPVAAGYALTLNITSPAPPWNDMVGGRIAVGGGTWVEVVAANDVASTVTVALLSIPFTIHDDDVDALLPYSTTSLHPLYQAAYQDAYIEPVLI